MRVKFIIPIILLVLVFLAPSCVKESGPAEKSLTIFHFNDLHGYAASGADTPGGLARFRTLIQNAENEGQDVLVVFGGDLIQGSMTSFLFKGFAELHAVNHLPVHAAAIGNHEFDFSKKQFDEMVRFSTFPWLSCNIVWEKTGKPVYQPYTIYRTKGGLRVGIIGLTTPELLVETNPDNVVGMATTEPVETASRYVKEIRDKSDLLILISHSENHVNHKLAEQVKGIDLIIAGHDHDVYLPPQDKKGVRIFEAGKYGQGLGRIDLTLTSSGIVHQSYNLEYPLPADVARDSYMDWIVNSYESVTNRIGSARLGTAKVRLGGDSDQIRHGETNLGDFVCDQIRQGLNADAVILNSGAFRRSIEKGAVTVRDLFEVFPFEGYAVRLEVKGATLRAALNHGLAYSKDNSDGKFPQVSGLRFVVRDEVAQDIYVGDAPLDDDRTYTLGVNSYIAKGGNGYKMLLGKPAKYEFKVRDYLEQRMRELETFGEELDPAAPRIRFENFKSDKQEKQELQPAA